MTDLAGPIDATMAVLRTSSDVAGATYPAPLLHGGEIDDDRIAYMPEPCIVVQPAGTPAVRPGTRDHVPVSVFRVDCVCYGESRYEANRIATNVRHALKAVKRGEYERHLVFWYHPTAGPVQFTDPDTGWKASVVTFNVMLADLLVPLP